MLDFREHIPSKPWNKRPCKRCDSMYIPCGRHANFCPKCIEKKQIARIKRQKNIVQKRSIINKQPL